MSFMNKGLCLVMCDFQTFVLMNSLDAVLIDVDRACRTNNVTRHVGVVDSCMYIVPRGARDTFCLDFMQLGWLLAWVLHPEGAYHKRTWEDLPQSVLKDQFLSDLLNCGQYSQVMWV